MNLIFTVLGAFTLGRLNVLLTWMSGAKGMGGASGFGDSPTGTFPIDYATGEVVGYGVVNLAITTVGVGLVLLGARLRDRRAGRVPAPETVTVG